MSPTDICITLIISVLGVALPILLQVISTLDDKYSSVLLVYLFNREKVKRGFIASLMAAVVASVLFLLQLPPLFDVGLFNYLLENSATFLLYVATVLLIIFLFLFVFKILQYLMPMRLIMDVNRRHNTTRQKRKITLFFFVCQRKFSFMRSANRTSLLQTRLCVLWVMNLPGYAVKARVVK